MIKIVPIAKGPNGTIVYMKRDNRRSIVKIGKRGIITREYENHVNVYERVSMGCKKHIVKPYELNEENIRPYIERFMRNGEIAYEMEYIHGVTLRDYLKTATKEQKKDILKQTEEAFTCIWKVGYIHGDAHLGNIMVVNTTNGPMIKIIDFGYTVKVKTPKQRIETKPKLLKWFRQEWKKVLKYKRIEKGNPNSVIVEPNHIPFFYKPNQNLLKNVMSQKKKSSIKGI